MDTLSSASCPTSPILCKPLLRRPFSHRLLPTTMTTISAVMRTQSPKTTNSTAAPKPQNLPTTTVTVTTAPTPTPTPTPTRTKELQEYSDLDEKNKISSKKNNYGPVIVQRPLQQPPAHAGAPSSSLAAAVCNALDGVINNFIDPPVLRPSVDPRHVLSDNFSPVGELPPTLCPVIRGSIPPCLGGGAYIRNGPNPQHLPRGPHHLFDGDGMLHSLLLPTGGGTAPATLSSRFVRTYKYLVERDAGSPVLPNVFSGFHGLAGVARGAVTAARVLSGQMNPAEGVGLANTSLLFFAGQLYALGESDLPYALHLSPDDGDISTLGRCDFQGRVSMGMTAHPKKDPVTGEMFAFRYGPVPPFLTYFRFDRDGNKKGPDVPIFSMTQPSFLHDFAITERYAIFPDIQIVMQPMEMVLGGGSPVGSDMGKVPRIGVLPRYAASESEMRWFEVPGFNIMHAVNAWEEEGGEVVVVVAPNVLSVEHALERTELVHSCVEMVRIDLRSGTVRRTPLSAGNLDFGVIHPGYVGRKNRYAYMGVGKPMPKISGVAKLDMEMVGKGSGDCVVARREFGPRCFAGEPFFVPARDPHAAAAAAAAAGAKLELELELNELEEDDGYVVSYVHDEGSGESRFVVMDARSCDLEVVAEVLLPRRVPYGFHGLFVTQSEIRSQRLVLTT